MTIFNKTRKTFLASAFAGTSAFIFSYAVGMYTAGVGFFLVLSTGIPDDYKNYSLADDLRPYLEYLQTRPVGPKAEVHETVPLQLALMAKGQDIGPCGADGVYGPALRKALNHFQRENGLAETEIANQATLERLYAQILNDKALTETLTAQLIAPFQSGEIKDFFAGLDQTFSFTHVAKTFDRPALPPYALVQGVFIDDFNDNPAVMAYQGCAQNHRRDAFRHANNVYKFAVFAGAGPAAGVADLREFLMRNPMPSMLTDLYNHKAAAAMGERHSLFDLARPRSEDAITAALKAGRFVTYPFPLIPRLQGPQ